MGLAIDQDIVGSADPWTPPPLGDSFSRIGACGKSFGRGIFKFHDEPAGSTGTAAIREAFPGQGDAAVAFAVDWLGVQYAVVAGTHTSTGMDEVVAFDPFDMSIVPIVQHGEFLGFLSSPLMLEQVRVDLFADWQTASGSTSVGWNRCASAVQPAFLGGRREISNLEESDVAVYWDIMTRAAHQAAGLRDGERLDRFR